VPELKAIDGWRRSLRQIALEEMLHLSLVNNFLRRSVHRLICGGRNSGASGTLSRRRGHEAVAVQRGDDRSLFFISSGLKVSSLLTVSGFDHKAHYSPGGARDLLSRRHKTMSDRAPLSRAINGLARLVEECGEENVFVGHGELKSVRRVWLARDFLKVNDLASAKRAIERNRSTRGRGRRPTADNSHYADCRDQERLDRAQARAPGFEPARSAASNRPYLTRVGSMT